MKKIFLTGIMALSLAAPALAQKSQVTSAWMYLKHDELDKAKTAIDQAAANAETKDDPKTWKYRGDVYTALSFSKNEGFKKLSADPTAEAITSYLKASQLDAKGKFPETADSLTSIALRVYNDAIQLYNGKEYEKALTRFSNFFDIYNGLGDKNKSLELTLAQAKITMNDVRTLMASSAQLANKPEVAEKLYQGLVDANTDEPTIYTELADMYRKKGDTAKALTVLDKGLGHLKDKKSLLIDKLNTYIQMGKTKEAIELGKEAISADPQNASIYLAMGNIYDYKLDMPNEAQDMYNKAIAVNPNDFNINYSLGASFFNQGATVYNQSLNEKDMNKATKLENQAKEIWKKSIPYMEKAHALKPEDKDVINVLAEVYAKLGDFQKSNEYRAKLKKK